MYTSFTGSTCSKSTLHHGFVSSRLCIQDDRVKIGWLLPSTALSLECNPNVLIIFVGLLNARFSKKRNKKHMKKCFKNLADRVLSLHPRNKAKDICKNINFCWLWDESRTAVEMMLFLPKCFCCRLGSGNKGSLASATAMRITMQPIKNLVVWRRENNCTVRAALKVYLLHEILAGF